MGFADWMLAVPRRLKEPTTNLRIEEIAPISASQCMAETSQRPTQDVAHMAAFGPLRSHRVIYSTDCRPSSRRTQQLQAGGAAVRDGDQVPARSSHRSSFENPPPGPVDDEPDLFAREVKGRQPSLAYRRRLADTRKAEADARRADIEVLEAEGRLRRQPLEEQELQARIDREEAGTARDLVYAVVPLVMLALLYIPRRRQRCGGRLRTRPRQLLGFPDARHQLEAPCRTLHKRVLSGVVGRGSNSVDPSIVRVGPNFQALRPDGWERSVTKIRQPAEGSGMIELCPVCCSRRTCRSPNRS